MAYVKDEAIKFYLQTVFLLVAKLYGLGMRQNLTALGAGLYGIKKNYPSTFGTTGRFELGS